MELRWDGYKKVSGQVCKRIKKRFTHLGLADYNSYRSFLECHADEWKALERMTRISISRFFRDRKVWEELGENILPALARQADQENRSFRCWSAGCASGEEPYSFAILWKERVAYRFPRLKMDLVATDANEELLKRAVQARYSTGSLKEVPGEWMDLCFKRKSSGFLLSEAYRDTVEFLHQDIREEMPEGVFDIIFCKNLVAMYFSSELATEIFMKIIRQLRGDGFLVLGNHETVPKEIENKLISHNKGLNLYRKRKMK